MIKALESSKNINLKSLAKAKKFSTKTKKIQHSLSTPKNHSPHRSQVIKSFETAINDLTNDHTDQDYNRVLDDLSPVQLTHALTSFLQQIKKPNHLEMRKEWTKSLWISDTVQVVNYNYSTNQWWFNEKSALNEMGKKSVSIWAW